MKTRGIAQGELVRRFRLSMLAQPCTDGTRAGLPARGTSWHSGGCLLLAALVGCLAFCPAWVRAGVTEAATEVSSERILAQSGFHGGLIVHAGCRDAALAVSLAKAPNTLVHGLVPGGDGLEEIRSQIRDAGLYGQVSAMSWKGPFLPYADGMVNLLLVLDENIELETAEIDRVLAPLGVAWIRREGVKLTSHQKAVARRRGSVVSLALRRHRQCRQQGQASRPAPVLAVGGLAAVEPRREDQRPGLDTGPPLLHPRRLALRRPFSNLVRDRARRLQRHSALAARTVELGWGARRQEGRPGPGQPPPGRRRREGVRHASGVRPGQCAECGYRGIDPHPGRYRPLPRSSSCPTGFWWCW